MRAPFLMAGLLALATLQACAPAPCRDPAVTQLRTLDRLIAETRGNLDRGYALGDRPSRGISTGISACLGSGGGNVGVSFCSGNGGGYGSASGPVAIDLAAERSKLDQLIDRRAALAAGAAPALAQCRAATSR